jgi:hypothetical protein
VYRIKKLEKRPRSKRAVEPNIYIYIYRERERGGGDISAVEKNTASIMVPEPSAFVTDLCEYLVTFIKQD